MERQFIDYLKRNGLIFSIYAILLVIVFNTALTLYYRNVITKNSKIKEQIIKANRGLEFMNKYVNLADLGLRGYMIEQDDKFLSPFNEAIANYQSNLDELRKILADQGFDVSIMEPAEMSINNYMELVQSMVQLCMIGEVNGAIEILRNDPGYDAWKIYSEFEREALAFENNLSQEATSGFRKMIVKMMIGQFILLLIGAPIMVMVILSLKRNTKLRAGLFNKLSASNKKYIFNSGKDDDIDDEEKVILELISNLKKSSSFINNITQGNYKVNWEGMSKENELLNSGNIAGELMLMREQMQKAKKEDEIRIWINEGLSKFGDLIREHQDDINQLSDKLISNIVQYLKAQQGGLFFIEEDEHKTKFLKLMGCYAYQRKKFQEKRIEIGQGLVGQCFLEGETTYLTDIPSEYVSITSGLGDTNPTTLLIVPLLVNEDVVGVIEIAAIRTFEQHQIEFLNRLAETIASSIAAVKTNESTRELLEQSQQQAEEMRAQEEEMRQNMEELQAAQEQMHRKNEEVENLLRQAADNEESMKMNLEALEELQEEASRKNQLILEEKIILEREESILSTLMEIIPDRITIKDKNGKYLQLSKSKYDNLKEKGFKNVIGQSDKEVFGEEHFAKSFGIEKEIMTSQKSVFNVEEQIEISTGVNIWGSTSRMPLKDKNGEILGTVVVTRDITKEKECEEEVKFLKQKD